ncbi:uncharacterized protein BJX67DRAFT_269445 [Aspergillus lucknowensis]|uniref:Fungal specific transcription factor n=1 Tax=Aspergillus lucknowensis TaxID=176173 RepID=A0ABR4LEV7_9EURO
MRMSRPTTTLLHLLAGLRTSTSAAASTSTALSPSPSTSTSPWTSPAKQLPLLAQCHATNLYYHNLPTTSRILIATQANSYSTTTMATSEHPAESSPEQPPNTSLSTEEEKQKPILALPPSSSADSSNSSVPQLDVNGDGVKLDHLGPLVVNGDGTLSRIANWAQMTEIERQNTLRVLGKRNKARMEALKGRAPEGKEGEEVK